jgi:hypothetical protein
LKSRISRILLVTTIVVFLFSVFYLDHYQKRVFKIVLDKPNPTEYIFSTPRTELYFTIFERFGVEGLSIRTIRNRLIIPEKIVNLLSQQKNGYDIFLESDISDVKSKIYKRKNNEFLDYRVSFYLHLEMINWSETKVSIITIDPQIIIGRELLPSPPFMVRRDKTQTVEPSTIEEYQILLEIGNLLGERNMPPLVLPNDSCKTEIFKY